IALNHTSDATLTSQANQTDTYPFSWFNGNDALVLKDVNTDVVMDVIGEIGVDPGESWEVGTGTTKDQRLMRKSHILTGNTDWQNGKDEWDTLPLDYFNDLGSHTFDCALPVSFVDFSVKTKNDVVELSWVSNGSDAGNYLILHSDDGLKFNRV